MDTQFYIDEYDRQHDEAVIDMLDAATSGRGRHSHLDDEQSHELWHLLWDAHNGDNSCRCLLHVIWAMQVHDEATGLAALRHCIANHNAGVEYRRAMFGKEVS